MRDRTYIIASAALIAWFAFLIGGMVLLWPRAFPPQPDVAYICEQPHGWVMTEVRSVAPSKLWAIEYYCR